MTKLLGVQAMLARVWVSVKEVVVITEVVVIQYSRNLPSRCFASGTKVRSLLHSRKVWESIRVRHLNSDSKWVVSSNRE